MLHLNTDSAVTVRYGKKERLVMLTSGEADFEVAHEPERAFRVFAGSAEVVAVGTKFDVRLTARLDRGNGGRGAGSPSGRRRCRSSARARTSDQAPPFVQLGADQQISVAEGHWPATAGIG